MSGARTFAEMPILDSSRAQTADGGASVLTRGRRSWQGTIAGIEDFKEIKEEVKQKPKR